MSKNKVSKGKSAKRSQGSKPAKKAGKPVPKKTASKPAKPKKASAPKKAVKPVKKAAPAKKTTVKKPAKIVKKTAPAKTKPAKVVAKNKVSSGSKGKDNKSLKVKAPAKTDVKVKAQPKVVVSEKAAEKVKKMVEEPLTKKQISEKKSQEVLAITNTIPVKQESQISLSKIASISQSITNPIKRNESYAVKAEKEPNGKFELEFVVHASAEMLYEFLSTASGLSEWFCDDLNIRNGIYTFIWEDQMQQARLLKTIEYQLVRFQWVDKTDGSYFEFRIQRDDLTNDISLIITDFAETHGERESAKLLWHSQIEKLMHVIGSIF